MIVLIGGTGTVGKHLVPLLLQRRKQVRVFTRDTTRAAQWSGRVEIAVGDLRRPETVRQALRGADAIYLVTMINSTDHDQLVGSLAAEEGVRRIVKLSTLEARDRNLTVGRWHFAKEEVLRSTGIDSTFLRPGMFMSNALQWTDGVRKAGTVFFPGGDGCVAPIDPGDVADVAAISLTESGHAMQAYHLTGPQLLTIGEMTETLGRVVGRDLKYQDVPLLAARLFMWKQLGFRTGNAMIELAEALKAGDGAVITSDFRDVTGRSPRTFDEWCADNIEVFR